MSDPLPENAMSRFLREDLGVSEASLSHSAEHDPDWTLVIKLHTYVEATLNFLLVKHFGDPRLEEVMANLEVMRGKLGFIKALDLLPKEHRSFIRKFSEIRNKLAHDVKNVDFSLLSYVEGLDSGQFKELSDAVVAVMTDFIPKPTWLYRDSHSHTLRNNPRLAMLLCVASVMTRVYDKHQVGRILSGQPSEPSEPIPKAQ